MTGEEFRTIRKASGMTQSELAVWLGVKLRAVQRWEAEETKIGGPVEKLMRQLEEQYMPWKKKGKAHGK